MGGRGGASHGAAGGRLGSARDFLRQAYGVRHANAILDILRKAPAHIQDMWAEFAGQFRASALRRGDSPDDAYYALSDDSVHLNIAYAWTSTFQTPYQVVFHEYGHMTDYLIARSQGGGWHAYSELYQGIGKNGDPIIGQSPGGGLLGRTAKEELKGHIARVSVKYADVIEKQAEKHSWDIDYATAKVLAAEARKKYSSEFDSSDISDMFEGAGIGLSRPIGVGHGLDYWIGRDNGKEIFAEIVSAEAANAGSLKAIKDYFPNTYKVYQDMMKARKKK